MYSIVALISRIDRAGSTGSRRQPVQSHVIEIGSILPVATSPFSAKVTLPMAPSNCAHKLTAGRPPRPGLAPLV